ncbi:heparan N-sulfatase [Adhaeribacter aerolatus]|uniref:Heparan N-sulfatase n=1 Tax=Adhaeribacter aerolatus TaxID=670289 RepID=A0A512B3B6_9BACT|nr:sulfatase [Adhaeribacter aerolatus]GEO06455.1 heparan N-sulfatase [Adhaeribacter aerolatus]
MNKNIPFFIFLSLSFFCFPNLILGQVKSDKRPNIIFIIADDVSWDDIGCYGNPAVRTPNIDKIAKQGIRFDNAYLTTSSCSPSRNSIISGRYPHNTGAAELHTPLPAEQIPFPLLLKEAGYYTVQAGKSHFGAPALRAFDKAYEMQEGGTGAEERWVKCLQERPKDKPIFAWLAAIDAHRPWQADNFGTPHDPAKVIVPPYLADTEATRKDIASYYNEIARFDFYIGEVMQELKRQGIEKNTLIMIMADNGRPFPRSKSRVYDSGMKTPFIIKWDAGIPQPGSVSKSLLSVIDIAPTLLELGGLKSPSEFQGKSFTKLFKDPALEFRQYVFSEHNWHDYEAHERMVQSKNFMYVLNSRPNLSNHGPADSNNSPAFTDLKELRNQGKLTPAQADVFMVPRPYEELYNCQKDPMQLLNVASLPEYQQELKTLRTTLANWRNETKDNTPENLTKDWFDRETGKTLGKDRQIRGEMPGVKAGATNENKPK